MQSLVARVGLVTCDVATKPTQARPGAIDGSRALGQDAVERCGGLPVAAARVGTAPLIRATRLRDSQALAALRHGLDRVDRGGTWLEAVHHVTEAISTCPSAHGSCVLDLAVVRRTDASSNDSGADAQLVRSVRGGRRPVGGPGCHPCERHHRSRRSAIHLGDTMQRRGSSLARHSLCCWAACWPRGRVHSRRSRNPRTLEKQVCLLHNGRRAASASRKSRARSRARSPARRARARVRELLPNPRHRSRSSRAPLSRCDCG